LYFESYEREKKERKEMKTKYKGDARESRYDYFHAAVVTKDDSDSILDVSNKMNERVDYESEYSINNSVHSNENEDLFE
jgi:hypothetical protein